MFSDERAAPTTGRIEHDHMAALEDEDLAFSDDREVPAAPGGGPVGAGGADLPAAGDVEFADDPELDREERAREQAKVSARSSGRMRALSSSSHRALPGQGDEWQRRERSAEEDAEALARLEQRLAPAPEGDPYLGKEVGTFKVEGFIKLERGVRHYLARDEASREPVVLRIFPLIGGYSDEMQRLAGRGERACRVDHPSLSICLGAGRTKDCFYAAHEPPLGGTVAELLAQGVAFGEEDVLLVLEQLAPALATLHARSFVHGDVSYLKVRRERPGSWVLDDAGLARARPELAFLSAGGEVIGTPGFLAPETVDAGKVEPSAELYALGCVAWTMLSGHPPFLAEDPVQSLLDQLNLELPPLARPEGAPPVSAGLAQVIRNLGGYTPQDRYKNVNDLVQDLRRVRKGEQVPALLKGLREDDAGPAQGGSARVLGAGALVLFVFLLIDVAVGTFLVLKYLELSKPTFTDPVAGYHLPLPGVGKASEGAKPTESHKPGG
ncbi:MAG: serine/threonine protein kinase [Planctomycetota bacterium]